MAPTPLPLLRFFSPPPPPPSPLLPPHTKLPTRTPHPYKCKAKNTNQDQPTKESSDTLEALAVVGGIVSNPVIGVSLYKLKTTGCGLPPGPGGLLGGLEGVSYLVVGGIVAWSAYTKVKSGSGLPNGPFGLLGAVEGLSYLTLVAVVVVFGLQFVERGYIPGAIPVPGDQCFG